MCHLFLPPFWLFYEINRKYILALSRFCRHWQYLAVVFCGPACGCTCESVVMAYRERNKADTTPQLGHPYGMEPRDNSHIPNFRVQVSRSCLGSHALPLHHVSKMMVPETEEGQFFLKHLLFFFHFYWGWMLVCELEDPAREYLKRGVVGDENLKGLLILSP